jgi:hypothetical protein
MNPRQTATIDRSNCPSVFDAGLPTINYEHAQHPDEAPPSFAKRDSRRRSRSDRTGRSY